MMLTQSLHYLCVLGIAVHVGTKTFFSFALTPALFSSLPREEAARAVRTGFPAFYLTGVIGLGIGMAAGFFGGYPLASGRWWLLASAGGGLAMDLYAWRVILPAVVEARAAILDPEKKDESDPAQRTWNRLHRLSVQLNGASLLAGMLALWFSLCPAH